MNDRTGTYQAMWFLKKNLKDEKQRLIDDMTNLSLDYWAGSDPVVDSHLKEITERIEVITKVLKNVETGYYSAPEE